MFFPYLSGAGTPHATDGATGSFVGLTSGTKPRDMMRSVYESIAYECRWNIDEMRNMGADISNIHIFSGGSRSRLLCQTIADALNIPVYALKHSDVATLGCARLVFRALGYPLQAFSRDADDSRTVWEPQNSAMYDAVTIYLRHRPQQPAVVCRIPSQSCRMREQWSDALTQGHERPS